jgi:glycerol-3-phosphate dehydrogenase
MFRFSVFDRPAILKKLQSEHYDLLIIGGGITGAGIALDAASRGLKTALVEKNDFAFGTSSRSTKLIHGGLRYLKQLEFGLVKEVGSERAIVHKLAPHLVIPEKMLLPLSEKRGLGYWLTSIGLKIYDYLAGVKPEDQRIMLTRQQTLRHEPLLRSDDIKGGALYAEYRTDDARLTIEIIKAAHQHGADILNYAKVLDFIYQDKLIKGVSVLDEIQNSNFKISATVVVNAAGPWVDLLREVNASKLGKRLHHTKGVHIVVPHAKFPIKQAIYFDVDDGRMIFAIPRGRITYVGTTDTDYHGDLDHVYTSKDDALYLITGVNSNFPKVNLKLSDIESSWAGLRPLIHEEGKSASQLSRKDEIFESMTGLISIAGGKLTGYRRMAERVVALVIKKHFSEKNLRASSTQNLKFSGADFSGAKEVKKYKALVQSRLNAYQIPEHISTGLVERFGRQTEIILDHFEGNTNGIDNILELLKSELLFCVENEMILTLADFFVRRTGMLYFEMNTLIQYKDALASSMKDLLQWDDQHYLQQQAALNHLIAKVKNW